MHMTYGPVNKDEGGTWAAKRIASWLAVTPNRSEVELSWAKQMVVANFLELLS